MKHTVCRIYLQWCVLFSEVFEPCVVHSLDDTIFQGCGHYSCTVTCPPSVSHFPCQPFPMSAIAIPQVIVRPRLREASTAFESHRDPKYGFKRTQLYHPKISRDLLGDYFAGLVKAVCGSFTKRHSWLLLLHDRWEKSRLIIGIETADFTIKEVRMVC